MVISLLSLNLERKDSNIFTRAEMVKGGSLNAENFVLGLVYNTKWGIG